MNHHPSGQVLSQDKELFSEIAVNAVLKLRGSTNLDQIQIIKRNGGTLRDSYLDPDGFLLDKKIGVGCPKVSMSSFWNQFDATPALVRS